MLKDFKLGLTIDVLCLLSAAGPGLVALGSTGDAFRIRSWLDGFDKEVDGVISRPRGSSDMGGKPSTENGLSLVAQPSVDPSRDDWEYGGSEDMVNRNFVWPSSHIHNRLRGTKFDGYDYVLASVGF